MRMYFELKGKDGKGRQRTDVANDQMWPNTHNDFRGRLPATVLSLWLRVKAKRQTIAMFITLRYGTAS